ncbi:glycosyltransferase family 2 protein [Croceibacter atlanticus]|uniref:glycosyltransferase family 2 protein n=1 Tax=Croceibacter atlanticus TaxID=313588 RepID=UPI0030D80195|tara:strand:- start:305602 stop:306513 length:912 start_codon:yes stop_codon:yes gene_type:complete
MPPKISIILATFNRCHIIQECLSAILSQTFKNFECLIIDDGSQDETKIVVKEYLEKDNRFKYILRSDYYTKGLSGARNNGLSKAIGEYIIFFDDDDIPHPQLLELSVLSLEKNKNANYFKYNKLSFRGEFDNSLILKIEQLSNLRIQDNVVEEMVLGQLAFASCTVLWRKKCFTKYRFNETLQYAEEWECFQRILCDFERGLFTDDVLYFNRKHEKSNTGQFWRNNKISIDSKKRAIFLIAQNLKLKNRLSTKLEKLFLNQSIHFRDRILFFKILKLSKSTGYIDVMRFYLFPVWRFFKKINL